MFKILEKKIINRKILKQEYIRYTQQTTFSANRENEKLFKVIPRKNLVISLRDRLIEIEVDVKRGDNDEKF